MNKTQKALKLAIEQMQHLIKIYIPSPEWSGTAIQEDCYETIQACKEALASNSEALATEQEPVAWISVNDRFPESETPVLIYIDGYVDVGALFLDYPSFEDSYQKFQYWDNPNNEGKDWEWGDVTHWMPLPDAPKEQA